MNWEETRAAWRRTCREDARSNDELLDRAASRRAAPEDDGYWEAIGLLRGRFDEAIFSQTRKWSVSEDATLRRVAADILSEADVGDESFKEGAGALLVEMLARETAPETLSSLAMALGHNRHPEGIPLLVDLRRHTDASVREGVAYALAGVDEPDAVSALIELTEDADSDVRDWATFALGTQTELDTPEIREALWRRTADEDPETQGEAVNGLASRNDPRVVTIIESLLTHQNPSPLVVEAAKEFPHVQFLPLLTEIDSTGKPDWMVSLLDDAIAACRTVL